VKPTSYTSIPPALYRRKKNLRAFNIPLKRFTRMKKWFPIYKDASLLIFCNGVKYGKSTKFAEKFARAGRRDARCY